MIRLLSILGLAGLSVSGCGAKPEWVIPKSGEEPCMCSSVCACTGMSQSEDSEKERVRCRDACDCEKCP